MHTKKTPQRTGWMWHFYHIILSFILFRHVLISKKADVVIISDCLYTNWVEDSAAALAVTLDAALGHHPAAAVETNGVMKQVPKDGDLQLKGVL